MSVVAHCSQAKQAHPPPPPPLWRGSLPVQCSWNSFLTEKNQTVFYPCLCLCFWFLEQMIKTRPRRLTEEQPSQIFLTEALTFMPRVAPNPDEGRETAALLVVWICCWRAIRAMAEVGRTMRGVAVKRTPIVRVNAVMKDMSKLERGDEERRMSKAGPC